MKSTAWTGDIIRLKQHEVYNEFGCWNMTAEHSEVTEIPYGTFNLSQLTVTTVIRVIWSAPFLRHISSLKVVWLVH